MGEKSNGDIAFLDTLLKRNNGKLSVLICGKFPQTDQYLHTPLTTKQVVSIVLLPPFLIVHISSS